MSGVGILRADVELERFRKRIVPARGKISNVL